MWESQSLVLFRAVPGRYAVFSYRQRGILYCKGLDRSVLPVLTEADISQDAFNTSLLHSLREICWNPRGKGDRIGYLNDEKELLRPRIAALDASLSRTEIKELVEDLRAEAITNTDIHRAGAWHGLIEKCGEMLAATIDDVRYSSWVTCWLDRRIWLSKPVSNGTRRSFRRQKRHNDARLPPCDAANYLSEATQHDFQFC
jgi:hypothetical protein